MNISYGTRIGPQHVGRGIPNQDACAYAYDDVNDVGVFALADGVGSHENSHLGSYTAVHAAVDFLEENTDLSSDPEGIGALLHDSIDHARSAARALDEDRTSCTLIVAVRTKDYTGVASVGDSFAVVQFSDGFLELVMAQGDSEYHNVTETIFTPSPNIETRVYENSEVTGIALSSDGLERSSLKNGEPFPGVWNFLFSYNAKSDGVDLNPFFDKLEASGKLEDDTTLLLVGASA